MNDPQKFCPNCGHALHADTQFCPQCGYALSGNTPAPDIPVEPEPTPTATRMASTTTPAATNFLSWWWTSLKRPGQPVAGSTNLFGILNLVLMVIVNTAMIASMDNRYLHWFSDNPTYLKRIPGLTIRFSAITALSEGLIVLVVVAIGFGARRLLDRNQTSNSFLEYVNQFGHTATPAVVVSILMLVISFFQDGAYGAFIDASRSLLVPGFLLLNASFIYSLVHNLKTPRFDKLYAALLGQIIVGLGITILVTLLNALRLFPFTL